MKNIRNALIVSAIAVSFLPNSLSAKLSVDDLVDQIKHARSCPVKPIEDIQTNKGWFSSFRTKVGNGLRSIGDHMRTEGNKSTPAGRMKEWVKETTSKVASSRLGISLKAGIFNPIGNGLRKLGQWVKGGQETQTSLRTTLNAIAPKFGAQEHEINDALRIAAAAAYKVDPDTSTFYSDVVQGMNNRGHKSSDAGAVYVEAVSNEIVKSRPEISLEDFAHELLRVGSKEIASHKSVIGSYQKSNAIRTLVQQAYKASKAKNKLTAAAA